MTPILIQKTPIPTRPKVKQTKLSITHYYDVIMQFLFSVFEIKSKFHQFTEILLILSQI